MLLQNSLCRNSDSEVQKILCSSTLSIFLLSYWKIRALPCTATAERLLYFSSFMKVYPLTIFKQLIRERASMTQTKPVHHLYTLYYRLPTDCNCPRKTKINFGALDISQHQKRKRSKDRNLCFSLNGVRNGSRFHHFHML